MQEQWHSVRNRQGILRYYLRMNHFWCCFILRYTIFLYALTWRKTDRCVEAIELGLKIDGQEAADGSKGCKTFYCIVVIPRETSFDRVFSTLLYPINLFPITCLVSPKSVTIVTLETASVQRHYISVHCSICVDVATFPQTNDPEKKSGWEALESDVISIITQLRWLRMKAIAEKYCLRFASIITVADGM